MYQGKAPLIDILIAFSTTVRRAPGIVGKFLSEYPDVRWAGTEYAELDDEEKKEFKGAIIHDRPCDFTFDEELNEVFVELRGGKSISFNTEKGLEGYEKLRKLFENS